MKLLTPALLITTTLIYGCATHPDEMSSTYVSPLKYKNYDCDQLKEEMDHVSHRTADLYASLDRKADDDATQMGFGLFLFWPTLFFLEGGDGPEASEYSNLKGEYEAIREAMVRKKCSSEYMPSSPEEIIKQKEKDEPKETLNTQDIGGDY